MYKKTFTLLERAIQQDYAGKIALVSSFGAESIILLHMVAQINRATPILFNQTEMLFPETLTYQREVCDALHLSNLRTIRPTAWELQFHDTDKTLHQSDTDSCCKIRKVIPIQRGLKPFQAWITGRKRFQSKTRANISVIETDAEGRTKINPLADWKASDIKTYIQQHKLPMHPLIRQGYPSIGCEPCTTPVAKGEDPRSGRWRGQEKIECGIHFENGKLIRQKPNNKTNTDSISSSQ